MEDLLILIVWLAILIYWLYVHFSFWKTLKSEDPAMYKANSACSPLKYSCGFAWLDLVLTNRHINSSSSNVISKGNALRHAYDIKFKLLGLGLLFSSLVFVITIWAWSN